MLCITAALILSQPTGTPNWIWAPGEQIPPHVFFRRDLDLPAKPALAHLAVTCDDLYELFVNGTEVAHHASWYTMQDVNLRPYLHPGRNVLAVDSRNIQGVAGLMVIGDIRVAGQTIALATGPDWRYSLQETNGWRGPDFDDSAWSRPQIIGPLGMAPWYMPTDEGAILRSMLALQPVHPTKRMPATPDSQDLARCYTWPPSASGPGGRFQQMRIEPAKGGEVVGKEFARPGSFIVNFGRELAGWVEVAVEAKQMPDLEIGVSESDDRFTVPPSAARKENGLFVFRILPQDGFTGLRFARITIKALSSPVRIKSVDAIWRLWPINYAGSFSCSDDVLNRIWEIGAYTVRLNLDPKALGAILVPARGDRYPWMGDDRVSHHVLFDCFGDYGLAKSDLDFFVKPGQKPIDVNDIPGYTLDWVVGLYDYWMVTGDSQEVRKHLGDLGTIVDEYATTATPKGWLFTDWEPDLQATTDETVVAFHIKFVQAARLAAQMASALGDPQDAARFRNAAAERLQFLQKRSDWPDKLPQHALSDALLAGLTRTFPDSVPATTTTPYFTYYVLEALSAAGQNQRALDALRGYWGAMLDLGATSTWEFFLPEWKKTLRPGSQPPDEACGPVSKCHPWSAGATAWLSEHVLGITPTAPGFHTCQIRPFFGRLKWAKGSVPTPHGPVSVSWTQGAHGPSISCAIPKGVAPTLVLPSQYRYRLEGRPQSPQTAVAPGVSFTLPGGRTYHFIPIGPR